MIHVAPRMPFNLEFEPNQSMIIKETSMNIHEYPSWKYFIKQCSYYVIQYVMKKTLPDEKKVRKKPV